MKFTITCDMEERWAKTFCAMLHEMEIYGKMGHSGWVSIYSDGDGDFRPKFTLPKVNWEEAPRVEYENYYDKNGCYIERSTHGTQKDGQFPIWVVQEFDDSYRTGARFDADYCSMEDYKGNRKYVEIPYKNIFNNEQGIMKCIITDVEDDCIYIKHVEDGKEEALDIKFLPSIDKYCIEHYGVTLEKLMSYK